VTPGVVSYSAVVLAFSVGAQFDRARGLLITMRQRGVAPDAMCYNAAISACEKGGNWEAALELLDEMASSGVAPTLVSYNAAITACVKANQFDPALALYAKVQAAGLISERTGNPDEIDLHGFTSSLASVAVRQSLRKSVAGAALPESTFSIIVGLGSHTTNRTITQLKPALVGMLAEPQFSSLGAAEDPANPGALVIARGPLEAWCDVASEANGT
jgi:pentatricopeptide repeat protein